MGDNFVFLAMLCKVVLVLDEGVIEGTQKEGRVVFDACGLVNRERAKSQTMNLWHTFSLSIVFLALALSSWAMRSNSSSSNSNFLFSPFLLPTTSSSTMIFPSSLPTICFPATPTLASKPIWTFSKSCTALSFASSSSRFLSSFASSCSFSLAFSSLKLTY